MLKVTSRKAVAPRPRYKPKMPFSFSNLATKAKEETFEGDLDANACHYNPFGDEKLLDTFVWRKKMDRDGKTHLTETEQRRMIQSKQSLNTKVTFFYNFNSNYKRIYLT